AGGTVAMVLLLTNVHPVLALLNMDPHTAGITQGYLNAFAWGIPAMLLMNALRGLTDGLGHTRVIMAFSVLSTLINLPLNYIFIYGKLGLPAMGGVGCGWATSLSNGVAAIALLIYLNRSRTFKQFHLLANLAVQRRGGACLAHLPQAEPRLQAIPAAGRLGEAQPGGRPLYRAHRRADWLHHFRGSQYVFGHCPVSGTPGPSDGCRASDCPERGVVIVHAAIEHWYGTDLESELSGGRPGPRYRTADLPKLSASGLSGGSGVCHAVVRLCRPDCRPVHRGPGCSGGYCAPADLRRHVPDCRCHPGDLHQRPARLQRHTHPHVHHAVLILGAGHAAGVSADVYGLDSASAWRCRLLGRADCRVDVRQLVTGLATVPLSTRRRRRR